MMEFFKTYCDTLTSFNSEPVTSLDCLYTAPYDKEVVSACISIAREISCCDIFDADHVAACQGHVLDIIRREGVGNGNGKENGKRNNISCNNKIQDWTWQVLNCLDYLAVDKHFLNSIAGHMNTFDNLSIEQANMLASPTYSDNAKWGYWTWRLGDVSNMPDDSIKNIVTPVLDMPAEYSFGIVVSFPPPLKPTEYNPYAKRGGGRQTMTIYIWNTPLLYEHRQINPFRQWFHFDTHFQKGYYCQGKIPVTDMVVFYSDRPPVQVKGYVCPDEYADKSIGVALLFSGDHFVTEQKDPDRPWNTKLYKIPISEFVKPETKWTINVDDGDKTSGHFGYRLQGGPFVPLTSNPTNRFVNDTPRAKKKD